MSRATTRALVVAALLALVAAGALLATGGEAFGWFVKVVAIERLDPPEVALARQEVRLAFEDTTGRAAPLQRRIEELVRAGDPRMRITAGAPYVLTVNLRRFLDGNTRSIDGTIRLTQPQGRVLYEGETFVSNAGALIRESDPALIEDAARRVARVIVPLRSSSAALVPKGRLRPAIAFAARGDWQGYLAAVDHLAPSPGPSDAYRQYAQALGHEGLAYRAVAAGDLDAALVHIREAVARNRAAARSNPSDSRLSELYTPVRRLLLSPCIPPMRNILPAELERWESLLRVRRWSSSPAAAAAVLDNRGVLELMLAGVADDDLVARISDAPGVDFALEQPDMAALSTAGLSWPVIDAMRSKAGLPKRPFWITPERW